MGEQLIAESVNLLLHGMGVVFVFLSVLVVATRLMSFVVNRFSPLPEPKPVPSAASAGDVDPLTVKIIQAALDQHRRRQ